MLSEEDPRRRKILVFVVDGIRPAGQTFQQIQSESLRNLLRLSMRKRTATFVLLSLRLVNSPRQIRRANFSAVRAKRNESVANRAERNVYLLEDRARVRRDE